MNTRVVSLLSRLSVGGSLFLFACAAPGGGDDDGSGTPDASSTPSQEATPTPVPSPPPADLSLQVSTESASATEMDVSFTLNYAYPVSFSWGIKGNEFSKTSPSETSYTFFLTGLTPETTYQYSASVSGTKLATGSFTTPAPRTGTFRVMFDDAHDEQAGNADWVVDKDSPPSPSNPSSESAWNGAYSAWGYELYATGRYDIEINRKALTYGKSSGDLADMDALIVPEPNSKFSSSEVDAIETFLKNGGGLFLIANHHGSDRNNDGWDAVEIWDDFLNQLFPVPGLGIVADDETDDPCSNITGDVTDPVGNGPYGPVDYMGFNRSATFYLDADLNSSVQGLVWPDNLSSRGDSGMVAARLRFGDGRIIALGDSAPADDGTGQSGDELYDSWSAEGQQNDRFFLNGTAWLVEDVGE